MLTQKTSRTRRIVRRVNRLRSELGYAQRRMFEIRTGVPVPARTHEPRRISRSVDELDRLYAA